VDLCEALDGEQRACVADYWWRRAEGELTSWVGFRHVLHDLRVEGSPAAVIALAERAVEDERRHSEFCLGWAARFGHTGGHIRPRTEDAVTFRSATDEENRLLRIAFCCFTESVGCFTLRHARQSISHPALRRLNQRHMADELQHSRVGWGHLAALDERRRDRLVPWIPKLLAALPIACCEGPEENREELVPYGYFTPRLLAASHADAMQHVIVPGLRSLGLLEAA
jgi:hypothetical protein